LERMVAELVIWIRENESSDSSVRKEAVVAK
jgi:hypothetical protein